MRCSRGLLAALTLSAAGGTACSDAFAPVTLLPPDSIVVQARSLHSVLLEWQPVADDNVIAYRVERRSGFTGAFVTVAEHLPQNLASPSFFLDDRLEPETFYGYRVRVVDRFGGVSAASVTRGARTPPVPSILLRTVSQLEGPGAADPDGYTVIIRSATDSIVGPVVPNGTRRFGPLPPGDYQVRIEGLAGNCAVRDGPMTRSASVTDVGLQTLTNVEYTIACSDPGLGRITAVVAVTGDNRDSSGVRLRLAGIHDGVPDSLRTTTDTARLNGPDGGQKAWIALRPGDFQVSIEDLDPKCVSAAGVLSAQVSPLSDDTLRFDVTCPTVQVDTADPGTPGYRLRNQWTMAGGSQVRLQVTIDMGTLNSPSVNGASPDDIFAIQGSTRYDSTRLRFVSATNVSGSGLQNLAVNGTRKGVVEWGNFTTQSAPQTGPHGIAVITFEALGGGVVATRSEVSAAESQNSNDLRPSIVLVEAAISLGGGGGGGGNTPPVAEANGPYSGVAGTPISFNSAGSQDPGGSIAAYSWTFGDGGTASTANPAHSYAAAGTYTVQLTVTDNQNATASDAATVTVSSSGGGNAQPVAVANGPYVGTAGTPVVFSAAGSNDPDGTITAYAWNFGDGTTGTGGAPQHTYAAAGTYTAVLTVTDNGAATASATASVSVAAAGGGSTPFTWYGSFSGNPTTDSLITLTITLDVSTDIPETPGPEEVQTYVVDSLKWNPAVLQFFSFNHGPGGFGSVQHSAAAGRLSVNGTLGAANRSGVIQIAVIRFRVLGTAGASTTTSTALGALTGTSATGSFSYRSRTRTVEASVTAQ